MRYSSQMRPLDTSSEWAAPYLEKGMSLEALVILNLASDFLSLIESGLYSIGPGDLCGSFVSSPLFIFGTDHL